MRVYNSIKRGCMALVCMLVMLPALCYAAEREVAIECSWGKIAATLAEPTLASDTAVLIVAGSGPTDRNGNSSLNIVTYSYKMLSDALVERGVAVLRYDKRGIGGSHIAKEDIPNLLFDDYVEDAAQCVRWLRECGYSRVIIAGHSEGGAIALEVAARDLVEVDALVLLCAAGYPIDKILLRQLSSQLMPTYMGLMVQSERILRDIKAGKSVAEEDIPRELISLFHPVVQPFLHNSMQYDPREAMARCEQPTLIISGGRDIQVAVDDGESLIAVARNGHHHTFERMSHVLKDAENAERIDQLVSVYTNPQLPLTEGLVKIIAEFITNI
ncbi:MAG: alpha/beta hydrolase [Rikenellaceae bacterium]|nr:alpha/beta hydrolase [Rikenellaceae bacterium]